MVSIKPKKLLSLPGVFKIPELMLSLTILLLCRVGGKISDGEGYILWGTTDNVDQNILGDATTFGFFVVILAQFVGYLFGEKANVQNSLLNLAGGACYIAIGSLHIHYYMDAPSAALIDLILAMGSLAIINGIVMLADAVFCVIRIRKDDD